jgi:hypothetical protein
MVVGENVPLRVDDHSRPQPFCLLFELLWHLGSAKEPPEEGIVFEWQHGIGNFFTFGHLNVDDRRKILFRHLDDRGTQIHRPVRRPGRVGRCR